MLCGRGLCHDYEHPVDTPSVPDYDRQRLVAEVRPATLDRKTETMAILKLESRTHKADSPITQLDYLPGYDRVAARISIGSDADGRPAPDIVLGVQEPKDEWLERQMWDPMELMAWRKPESGENGRLASVDIIHVFLYRGDRLWLMNDDGSTIDRLFPG